MSLPVLEIVIGAAVRHGLLQQQRDAERRHRDRERRREAGSLFARLPFRKARRRRATFRAPEPLNA